MLKGLRQRLEARLSPGIYEGLRAGLLPLDGALSLLAKRSYPLYRLWNAYSGATEPWFDDVRRPPAAPDAERAAQLGQDGYVAFPGPFEPACLAEARDFVLERYRRAIPESARREPDPMRKRLQWQEDGLIIEHFRPGGRYRFYFTEERLARGDLPRLIADFADPPVARALAEAYFGTRRLRALQPYLMAEVLEPGPLVESWHVDCVRPTLKAMLYLGEVGLGQGPLRYLCGTHRVDEERHRQLYAICRSGLGVSYFDKARCQRYDREAQRLTGPAGTLICFDSRGIHAGSLCREGCRVALVTGFRPPAALRLNPRQFRDPRPLGYPWERDPEEWREWRGWQA